MTTIEKTGKRRGRKPKGGKIITNKNIKETNSIVSNIILHLKCNTKLLHSTAKPYEQENFFSNNSSIDSNNNFNIENKTFKNQSFLNGSNSENSNANNLNEKLEKLQYLLHNNNPSGKLSSCFWCTCSFNNLPVYIPKNFHNNYYNVYGCFCSPECAAAYLMNESIDTSSKFERYQLLHNIYKEPYGYKKSIKPAPSPFYTLNKYFGSLDIDEYRNLSSTNKIVSITDKPLTSVLPELHIDNTDLSFNSNNKSNDLSIKLSSNNNNNSLYSIINKNFGNSSNN